MICKLSECSIETAGETIRYCSAEHKRIGLSLQRKNVARNVALRFGVCSECGVEFQAGLHGPMPSKCESHRSRDLPCMGCGTRFSARPGVWWCNACLYCEWCEGPIGRGRKRFCKDACREASAEAAAEKAWQLRLADQKPCLSCGATIVPSKYRPKKYCSDACLKRPSKDMRAKRLKHVAKERFDRVDIYERDSWICQLCNEPVDKTLKYPNLMSASLDHILPVSLGGAHTTVNVQLAHLGCNISKGNRVEVAS
jgi:hypothetical protein